MTPKGTPGLQSFGRVPIDTGETLPVEQHIHQIVRHSNYSTLLAAQRTLLSYVRTAISISAIGHSYGASSAWVLVAVGAMGGAGVLQYVLSSLALIGNRSTDSIQTIFQVTASVVSVVAIAFAAVVVVHNRDNMESDEGTDVSGALGTL
jgi:uncharacterized membrane protein YidH (DUF202 family)